MTSEELFKKLEKLRGEVNHILGKRTSIPSKAKAISKAYESVGLRSTLPEELCAMALDRSKGTLPLFYEVIVESLTLGIVKKEDVENFSELLGNLMYLKHGKSIVSEQALTDEDKKIVSDLAGKIKLLTH